MKGDEIGKYAQDGEERQDQKRNAEGDNEEKKRMKVWYDSTPKKRQHREKKIQRWSKEQEKKKFRPEKHTNGEKEQDYEQKIKEEVTKDRTEGEKKWNIKSR